MSRDTLFQRAMIFDGWSEMLKGPCDVRIADGIIREISETMLRRSGREEVVACNGHTLMPGLIDAHVHVYAASVNLGRAVVLPHSYLAHFAARFLRAALDSGFTTVRDVGGADVGLANALRDGLLAGPRLYYGGRVISQTGGHGDYRACDELHEPMHLCGCASYNDNFAVLADGVDAVRRAVREEFRRGASHIKLMASGGVASPNDPLDRCQYSGDEIRAAVDEATRSGGYVAAHCHPAEAILRCVQLGVRSIEHATMVDELSARVIAEEGAFAVPTMAVIFGLLADGERMGFPSRSMEKLRQLSEVALSSLETMKNAGVKMGFGTDLLGDLHVKQCEEFALRARVLSPIEILRSVCMINAELLQQSGRLGCVREGARADLLLLNGNPLQDINLLAAAGRNLAVIMKDGRFHKRLG